MLRIGRLCSAAGTGPDLYAQGSMEKQPKETEQRVHCHFCVRLPTHLLLCPLVRSTPNQSPCKRQVSWASWVQPG